MYLVTSYQVPHLLFVLNKFSYTESKKNESLRTPAAGTCPFRPNR
jgi:hypothetical protein